MKRKISKIEVISNTSGDWLIVKVNDEEWHSGHDIPPYVFLQLFEEIGVQTGEKWISDEDMEEIC